MQDEIQQRVDRIRRSRSELENHVIDEFFARNEAAAGEREAA